MTGMKRDASVRMGRDRASADAVVDHGHTIMKRSRV